LRSNGQKLFFEVPIRYVSADDEFEPPTVTFAVDPSQEQNAEFILHPDANEAVLWQPGSALIVRTVRPIKMQVEVTPRRQTGSIAAINQSINIPTFFS
jgi:hypothetical protein